MTSPPLELKSVMRQRAMSCRLQSNDRSTASSLHSINSSADGAAALSPATDTVRRTGDGDADRGDGLGEDELRLVAYRLSWEDGMSVSSAAEASLAAFCWARRAALSALLLGEEGEGGGEAGAVGADTLPVDGGGARGDSGAETGGAEGTQTRLRFTRATRGEPQPAVG